MPRVILIIFILCILYSRNAKAVTILSKSKMEKCRKDSQSDSNDLICDNKILIDIAVPTSDSGGEAFLEAQLVEVTKNDSSNIRIRKPPTITMKKSAAFAVFELKYMRDVAYKPEEHYVETHKCESDASSDVVHECERLRDDNGNVIEYTQPICCPCGPERRVHTSCGNIFTKMIKGKPNTAHCLRFSKEWFHVFAIGVRTTVFNVTIEVKQGSAISTVVVGPKNKTTLSDDKFLKAEIIGDFDGYQSIPLLEHIFLVTPRQNGEEGPPRELGSDFSRWMLLERTRFTLGGLDCNKIGVSYAAFSTQPDFCDSPFSTCLQDQLFHFWEEDLKRLNNNEPLQYVVAGQYERINQHPDAGNVSFSVGITEDINTNLLIELGADDIEFVYQRSPGKIIKIDIPTFETLKQLGKATVTVKNIGTLEASYSLTFDCNKGINAMEEQSLVLKPDEVLTQPFFLHTTTDQAEQYNCTAILKDSDFSEVDRAECKFTTTATVLDNGTEIVVATEDNDNSWKAFFIKKWRALKYFFSNKACRNCPSFFDYKCHMDNICISSIMLLVLMIAVLAIGLLVIWLMYQKGLFDCVYDCWHARFKSGNPDPEFYNNQKKDRHDYNHNHHRRHHQSTVHHHHPSSSRVHKRRKPDEIHHHHHHHKNKEIELERGEYNHNYGHGHHGRHGIYLGVQREDKKHKHSRWRDERNIEPLLREMRDEVFDANQVHFKH